MIKEAIERLLQLGALQNRKIEFVEQPDGSGWAYVCPNGAVEFREKRRPFRLSVQSPAELLPAWRSSCPVQQPDLALFVGAGRWSLWWPDMLLSDEIEFMPEFTAGFRHLVHWSNGDGFLAHDAFMETLQDDLTVPAGLLSGVKRIKLRAESESASSSEAGQRYVASAVRQTAALGDDLALSEKLFAEVHTVGGSIYANMESPFTLPVRLKVDFQKKTLGLKASRAEIIAARALAVNIAAEKVSAQFKADGRQLEVVFGELQS